jgi:hypothetical protein
MSSCSESAEHTAPYAEPRLAWRARSFPADSICRIDGVTKRTHFFSRKKTPTKEKSERKKKGTKKEKKRKEEKKETLDWFSSFFFSFLGAWTWRKKNKKEPRPIWALRKKSKGK